MVTSPVEALTVAEFGFVLAKVNAPAREEVGGASVKPGLEAVYPEPGRAKPLNMVILICGATMPPIFVGEERCVVDASPSCP